MRGEKKRGLTGKRGEGRGEMVDGKEEKSETVENRECGPGT